MAYELKEGQGSIFKNSKKEKDSHPDYQGEAIINGKLIKIALWVKDGQKGKFFSGSFKNKDDYAAPKAEPDPFKEQVKESDLPF